MHRSVSALINTYKENPSWTDILAVIRHHEIDHETTVDEVLTELAKLDTKETWSRGDVVTCFKEFRDLGFATITKGVKSKKTRLTWMFPPRAVVEAAMGNPDELQRLLSGTPITTALTLNAFRGKRDWSLDDLLDALSQLSGLPVKELSIRLTIPEARKILAASQNISPDDVLIRMG
jgi:hypothetical protein